MNRDTQDFYVREVQYQADLSLIATSGINHLINTVLPDKSKPASQQIYYMASLFRDIHSFLTHASNISKIFWPVVSPSIPKDPVKRHKRQNTIYRGDFLRDLFDILPDNILEKREVRNHLEHFDERLDDFLANRTGSVVDRGVGQISTMFVGIDPKNILRHYEQEGNFVFRGESYSFVAIEQAVIEVQDKAKQLLSS